MNGSGNFFTVNQETIRLYRLGLDLITSSAQLGGRKNEETDTDLHMSDVHRLRR